MEKRNLLFVYGTLMNGFNNHYLLKNSMLLGLGKTKQKFIMSANWIPFVSVPKSEKSLGSSNIFGEVYNVPDHDFKKIDDLEGHPHHYKREKTEILMQSGEYLNCWIYLYPHVNGMIIPSGDYTDYIEYRKSEFGNLIEKE